LKHIAEVEKVNIDFIYYTGDLPPHNIWNQSRSDQLYSINTINQLLATLFPNKTFYSAVGNHEAGIFLCYFSFKIFFFFYQAPCGMYPTPNIRSDNISWLYQALADNWIKIDSLNMNYCTDHNLWLLINSTDPLNQLQWVNYS
jgi:sphingomyelin phosphodiesterase